jgi:hypothetical protein
LQQQQDKLGRRVVKVDLIHTVEIVLGWDHWDAQFAIYPFRLTEGEFWALHINQEDVYWLGAILDVSNNLKIEFVVYSQGQAEIYRDKIERILNFFLEKNWRCNWIEDGDDDPSLWTIVNNPSFASIQFDNFNCGPNCSKDCAVTAEFEGQIADSTSSVQFLVGFELRHC